MNSKVTIQDIANALGISRNTASKALNQKSSIPEETRTKVINKAIELKYKQFAFMESESSTLKQSGNIALLSSTLLSNSHFGSFILSGLEKRISQEGYNLSIHIIRELDIKSLTLPSNFDSTNVDGILCIEMFNADYSNIILGLNVPTIFIDCAADVLYPKLNTDIILMENEHSTYYLTKCLIDEGISEFGFVGDFNHCKSFNERWSGFNRALKETSLPLDMKQCIVEEDHFFIKETDWFKQQILKMDKLPQAFVCANDFLAIGMIRTLKELNVNIPTDIKVTGFDDAPQSKIIDPELTTVKIFNDELGFIAAEMLLSRINNPQKGYQITHVQTEPIFRASTGH